jgi:hypothetical protein
VGVGASGRHLQARHVSRSPHVRQRQDAEGRRAPSRAEGSRAGRSARLGDAIAATVERAKANDPKALKARVTELEKQLAAKPVQPAAKVETKTVEKAVIKDSQLNHIEKLLDRGDKFGDRIVAQIHELEMWRAQFGQDLNQLRAVAAIARQPQQQFAPNRAISEKPSGAKARPVELAGSERRSRGVTAGETATHGDAPACSGALRRIMIALAQHPEGLTDRKIGVFSGVSTKGGSFGTYLSRARGAGWIDDNRGGIRRITEAGIAAVGDFEPLPTGPELAKFWTNELGGATARILKVLIDAYPEGLHDETIGERAEVSTSGGSFGTYLSRLRSRDLLDDLGGRTRKASDTLFEVAP